MRVLIADDAPDIRLLVRTMLAASSVIEVVGEAETPEDTVKVTEELAPDVIVLDQSFGPYARGTDIAPQLKEAAPAAKIVLFTAYQEAELHALAQTDVDAFVLKTRADELPAVVEQVGNRSRHQQR